MRSLVWVFMLTFSVGTLTSGQAQSAKKYEKFDRWVVVLDTDDLTDKITYGVLGLADKGGVVAKCFPGTKLLPTVAVTIRELKYKSLSKGWFKAKWRIDKNRPDDANWWHSKNGVFYLNAVHKSDLLRYPLSGSIDLERDRKKLVRSRFFKVMAVFANMNERFVYRVRGHTVIVRANAADRAIQRLFGLCGFDLKLLQKK